MILSVSRRTDIPNYYSEWFINLIYESILCENRENDKLYLRRGMALYEEE